MKHKILIVEDDLVLADILKEYLEEEGFDVIHTHDGAQATSLFKQEMPDLIILDIMLPNKNGFGVINEIIRFFPQVSFIMMTGSELREEDKVHGYELGAINYIEKPVLPRVLLAQIRQLLNRYPTYRLNDIEITLRDQFIEINGRIYEVRERDALIFSILLNNPGEIISRSYLLNRVWKSDDHRLNNQLDGAVTRLRKLLSEYPSLAIDSIYGKGYILNK